MNLVATSAERAALTAIPVPTVQTVLEGLEPTPYLFTVAQFQTMHEQGVFGPEDRVELIEGRIVAKMGTGLWHTYVINYLIPAFSDRLRKRAILSVQNSFLFADSMPMPDMVLLRPRVDGYFNSAPTPADVLLIVEVSDTTLKYDRGTKLQLYSKERIPEYWIVSRDDGAVEVCREPTAQHNYASRTLVGREQLVAPSSLADILIPVDEILGPAEPQAASSPPA